MVQLGYEEIVLPLMDLDRSTIVTIFSCLSYWKTTLVALNENGDVVVLKLQEDTITVPASIRIIEYCRMKYTQKLICCEISQDERYLAIGFEDGDISVSFQFVFTSL